MGTNSLEYQCAYMAQRRLNPLLVAADREAGRAYHYKRYTSDFSFKTKIQARQRAYYAQNLLHKLVLRAKNRAKKNGWEFTINEADVSIPARCPVLGIKLALGLGSRGAKDFSPTLDRMDNTKGYVKGNVCVLSWRANRLKNNGTVDEFEKLVMWLRGKL